MSGHTGVWLGAGNMRSDSQPAARLTAAAAAVAVAVTVLVTATPIFTFGVRSPSGHLLLNALDACVGLLVAFLLYGKFLRSGRLQDLLLSQGLALLVVAGLGLAYVAQITSEVPRGTLDVWLPLTVRMAGVLFITAAALTGGRSLQSDMRRHWAWAPLLAVVIMAFLSLWTIRSGLPVAIDLADVPDSAMRPILTGHPLLLGAQGWSAVCFLISAALFTHQASQVQDPLLRWVGPACVLNAFARINYLLFPSLYTDWLYTGDVLRTGAYLLLLVGAVREIQHYWHTQAEAAVLDDRRRLARELHDGVIQELAFIKSEAGVLGGSAPERGRILVACDRALDEARAALHALGSPGNEPLSASVERAVRQLGERHHVDVVSEVDPTVAATPEQRHALVRIAREAVTNAVRHGGARSVRVELRQQDGQAMLQVRDDGRGFEPAHSVPTSGYGVISMSDRAHGLPGTFEIESAPGQGTRVTIRWEAHS